MHGADRLTSVTLIENASRNDQRIIPAILETLADVTAVSGPAVIFLGLAPREAVTSLATLPQEEFA